MLVLAGSVLLVFVLALTGTATPESGSEAASLPPVVWELIELPGDGGEPVEIAEPERYTIQFLPEGKVAIQADCNRAGGGAKVEDGSIEFALLAATLALCPPDSQAEPFMAQLTGTKNFSFDDEGTLFLEGEQGAMRLRPSLAGVVWEWREFQGMDDSTVTPDDPSHYTLEFLPEGRITVRADCNRGFGTYTTDGPMMTLEIIGLTRAMCPPDSLADRFVEDVGMVSSHVFREGMLYLALPVDAGILAFEARYVAPEPAAPAAG